LLEGKDRYLFSLASDAQKWTSAAAAAVGVGTLSPFSAASESVISLAQLLEWSG
jgi:hypothetical protein